MLYVNSTLRNTSQPPAQDWGPEGRGLAPQQPQLHWQGPLRPYRLGKAQCRGPELQFTQSCPTLCDPMNGSTPGLPVHHQLSEFTQTHVHRVGDAIQPSHALSSPSPPAPNPSQQSGLFQWSTLRIR